MVHPETGCLLVVIGIWVLEFLLLFCWDHAGLAHVSAMERQSHTALGTFV